MNRQEKFEYRKSYAEIIISIISVLLVLLTLFEMQADRNAAYRPDISIPDVKVAISWENSETSFAEFYDNFAELVEGYSFNTATTLQVYNIGVGTAKDITLEWNHEANVKALNNVLTNYDDIYCELDGNRLRIKSPSMSWEQGVTPIQIAEFMLNSTTEYHETIFPDAYSFLIREFLIRELNFEKLPTFLLDITYSDVQNKTYKKQISVSIEHFFSSYNESGDGICIYSLHFTEDNSMTTLGSIALDNDSLTALSSVFAVLISIISMIFTIIYSQKQNEHNRNSVRPIASIKFDDYEDRIAVKIENVGTGPLIITSLKLIKENLESKTLLGLMPDIDQSWTTYVEEVDGRTIPVGGCITLIELEPINDEIKNLIRKTLCEITASIDYADIYSTKFNETRSLEFFGRHFN